MQKRRFNVGVHITGEIKRQVWAKNEEEAKRKVLKAVFRDDEITPKSNLVEAFFWQREYSHVSVDMTHGERETVNGELRRITQKRSGGSDE